MDKKPFLPIYGKMPVELPRGPRAVRPMQGLKILSAAGTLEKFTVHSLLRLSGQPEKTVRYWVSSLERRELIRRSGSARISSKGRTLIEYTWESDGRAIVEREILDSLPQRGAEFLQRRVDVGGRTEEADPTAAGTELDFYEDPFTTALSVAEQWTVSAEEARDEATVQRYLDLATAEVRSLRSLLRDLETDQVRDCERLARRLERLSQRPPIEAFRSRIKQVFRDALDKAAVALGQVRTPVPGERLLDEELALVLNATRRQEDTARVVENAVGQVGRACYVFEMAQATASRRREAINALGPLFTGPGSAAVKLFVVLDSRDGARSYQVMDELISLFGDSSRISGLLAADRSQDSGVGGTWGTALPVLVMAATSMPTDDWLPRGLAKQALLQTWVTTQAAWGTHEMARVTLNDPVIFDCSQLSVTSQTDRPQIGEKWAKFSYHHVALNQAAVRGLVMGSFNAAPELHHDLHIDTFADQDSGEADHLFLPGGGRARSPS